MVLSFLRFLLLMVFHSIWSNYQRFIFMHTCIHSLIQVLCMYIYILIMFSVYFWFSIFHPQQCCDIFFLTLVKFLWFCFWFQNVQFYWFVFRVNLLTLLWDILYTLRLYRFITILMIFKRDCKLFLIMTFDLGNKIVQTVSTITCQNVPSVSLTAWTQDSFLVFYVCL